MLIKGAPRSPSAGARSLPWWHPWVVEGPLAPFRELWVPLFDFDQREFTLISGSIAKFGNLRTLARNAAEQIHERFAIPRILSIVIFDEAGHDWKFDNRPEPSPPSQHNVDDLAMSIFRGRLESLGESVAVVDCETRES
jgi:hypothetical protein